MSTTATTTAHAMSTSRDERGDIVPRCSCGWAGEPVTRYSAAFGAHRQHTTLAN